MEIYPTSCSHGIDRRRERCRFCEPDYTQFGPVANEPETRRERIATQLLIAGKGNVIECVETADLLDKELDKIRA